MGVDGTNHEPRAQLRRCEAGWEGSRRQSRDPRYANRIGGGAVWASQHVVAKPDAIKGPSRKCGGCAVKVAGLIRGDLSGCRRMSVQRENAVRRVGRDGGGRKAAARWREVSRGLLARACRARAGCAAWYGGASTPSSAPAATVAAAIHRGLRRGAPRRPDRSSRSIPR